MHEVAQRPSERRSLEVDFFRLNEFESYYKFTRGKKGIDICCVGSDVKYQSLPYWSIVMTSAVEFSTRHNQLGKNIKGLLEAMRSLP